MFSLRSKQAIFVTMGRGKHCTDYQRHIIKRMAVAGIKRRTIEFVMERSRTFVANALRTTETRKSPERPRKTTAEEDHKIVNISKKHQSKFNRQGSYGRRLVRWLVV